MALLLACLLAAVPALSCASWMDDWYGYDNSSYGSYDSYSGYGDELDALMGLLGGLLEDEGDDNASLNSWEQDSAYDSWLDGILGGDGSNSSIGAEDPSPYGSVYESIGGLASLFGYGLDSDTSWIGGSGTDVTAWSNPAIPLPPSTGDETTWAVYWYLCGSDLETDAGLATDDLLELLEVTVPENVSVVIETGGARDWQNNVVSADKLQRWLYQGGEFSLIDEQPSASMGRMETLAAFLDFCNRHFPADKRAVILWNHGGGSVAGAAFDEKYRNDSLSLTEMKAAFEAVFDRDEENPPFEMIGFDACLMATVDVAHIFRGYGRYLVASEETAPGTGWDYGALLTALGENPGMSGAELGRIICDSYASACKASRWHDSITLSVTDLTRMQPLAEAYEAFGAEALRAAAGDRGFFTRFARAAERSENYGGNTREQGYANMVDLGHLARLTADLLPSAQAVTDALDGCIVYRVNGPYRSEATGLSCYYSYSGDLDDLGGYAQEGMGDAFAQYYYYGLTGRLTEEGEAILHQQPDAPDVPAVFETLADTPWDGVALSVDADGVACLNLGPQAQDILAGIGFQLFWIDDAEDLMLFLGTDNDMEGSWEEGVFYDNFRGVWGSLNDQLVYMELSFEGEDYNLYSVPVLLNDEECHLQVAYDFASEEWLILGARKGLEASSGMAPRDVRLLREGDIITPVWYAAPLDNDGDFEGYAMDPITITEDLAFGETALPDGLYGMSFEMWDVQNHYVYSEPVYFEVSGGDIYTYTE